jgi:hypothetical protein
VDVFGSRRLFSLVTMLPADSALAAFVGLPEPTEPVAPRKPVGSWGDLAKTLTTARGLKKRGTKKRGA